MNEQLSVFQASLAIFKIATGAASFTVAKALSEGGVLFSVPFAFVVAALAATTIWQLVESEKLAKEVRKRSRGYEKVEEEKQQQDGNAIIIENTEVRLTYSEIATIAFPFPKTSGALVSLTIIVSIVGICATYLLFLSSLVEQLCLTWLNRSVSTWAIVLFISPFESFLSCLESYQSLRFTTMLGALSLVLGCLAVVVSGLLINNSSANFQSVSNIIAHHGVMASAGAFSRYLSKMLFLFAVHICAYPILQSQNDESKTSRVLFSAFTALAVFNVGFGIVGLLLFENVQENILLNLPPASRILSAVQVFVCLDLAFTFPLVLAVARSILEPLVLTCAVSSSTPSYLHASLTYCRYLVRVCLSYLCVILAICFPSISGMVSIVGGVVCALLGFVVPPLLHCCLLQRLHGHVDITTLVPCSALFVFGIYSAISNLLITSFPNSSA